MNEKPHEDECRCTECAARWGRFWRTPEIEIPWFEQVPASWSAILAAGRGPAWTTPSGAEVGSDGRV